MLIEEVLLEKIRALSVKRQQEMLDFAEFLAQKEAQPQPRVSLEGIWADLDVNITEGDMAEVRREMWGNFPREHFFDKEENV